MTDLNEILIVKNAECGCNESGTACNDGFKYLNFDNDAVLQCTCSEKNCILLLIKGSVVLNTDTCYRQPVAEGEMCLLPQASSICLKANAKTQIVLLSFNNLTDVCDNTLLLPLNQKAVTETEVHTLCLHPSLTLFTETLMYCLTRKTMSAHWHRTMSQEFFLLLNEFYPNHEIIGFLTPATGKEFRFRKFVLQNYTKVRNINELIELSQFSRSMFYAKFKEVFGITAKQWLLQQTAIRLLEAACKPGMSVKGLLDACDFDSPSQLNRYIRQTFNCTPKELIEQNQNHWI